MTDALVLHNGTDRLFDMDGKGDLTQGLAEAHTVSVDGLEHEFRIRSGRRFHDGTPVTAADCAAALRRLDALAEARIEVLDAQVLRVVSRRQLPGFLDLLTTCPIVNARGVASGPYKVVESTADYQLLEAHDGHPALGVHSYGKVRLERLPAHIGNYKNLLEAGSCVLVGSGALSWASRNRARGKWASHVFATGCTHVLCLRPDYPHTDFVKHILQGIFTDREMLAGDGHLREALSFYPKGTPLYEPIRLKRAAEGSATLRLAVTRGLMYPELMQRLVARAALAGLTLEWIEVETTELGACAGSDGRIVACAIDARDPLRAARAWFAGERGLAGRLPADLERLLSRAENVVRPSDRSAFLRQFYFNLFAHGNALPLFFSPNALVYSMDVDTADLDFHAGTLDFAKLARGATQGVTTEDPTIGFKMLAHDLRRPFTLVKAIVNALKATDDPVRLKSLLEAFAPEVERVTTSVDGMLRDMMRRDGPRPPCLTLQSLSQILLDAVRTSLPPQSEIEVELDLLHEHMVEVDRGKIDRVIGNLLTNAAQAMGSRGRIWIRTADVATSAGAFVEVKVGNSNSYIAPDDLKQLFQPWFTKGKEGGTGLGLAIAQKFVQSHGGTIAARSAKDTGTEFTFTLPAAGVAETPPKAATRVPPVDGAMKIAVLEDNVFLLELWREQLGDTALLFERPEDFFSAAEDPRFLAGLDAVITDFYFDAKSDATGADVARFLRRREFDAKVLLASDSVGLEADLALFHGRQAKEPPTREALRELLRQP
jgi:signal transduction histidine kinase